MSRIGKQPIPIPSAVQVALDGHAITIKGPKGELRREIHPDIQVAVDDGSIVVTRPSDRPNHRALHGLTRALLANMVIGVESGYSKTLEMQGIGYRGQLMGSNTQLASRFPHPPGDGPADSTSPAGNHRGLPAEFKFHDGNLKALERSVQGRPAQSPAARLLFPESFRRNREDCFVASLLAMTMVNDALNCYP